MPLSTELSNALEEWLGTLSPPRSMSGNQTALTHELDVLESTIERSGISSVEQMEAAFVEYKRTARTRSWPTAAELIIAISATADRADIGSRGDRSKLSMDERNLLENDILPAARRWLSVPGLKDHGEKTLNYWQEGA